MQRRTDRIKPETRAFIEECRAPSIADATVADRLVAVMVEASEKIEMQTRRYARQLTALERTEEIEPITAVVEEAMQKCRALQKELADLERLARRVARTERDLRAVSQRITAEAERVEVAAEAIPNAPGGDSVRA